MKKKKWICLLLSALLGVGTALPQQSKESPVEKVKKIGDKLIRETPFAYKLGLASCSTSFNTLNFVDFGRTFGVGQEAVAYAYTMRFRFTKFCLSGLVPLVNSVSKPPC